MVRTALLASTALVGASVASVSPVHADSLWAGVTDDYNDPGNWSGISTDPPVPGSSPVPTGSAAAYFDRFGPANIRVTAPTTSGGWNFPNCCFSNQMQNFNFTGAAVDFNGSNISFTGPPATVTIANQLTNVFNLQIAFPTNLVLTGTGSTIQIVNVSGFSQVEIRGGSLTVKDMGYTFMGNPSFSGAYVNGTVSVTNGGSLTVPMAPSSGLWVENGTLNLGTGGLGGSLTGRFAGTMIANFTDSVTLSSTFLLANQAFGISVTSSLEKRGSGTLTLDGTQAYTGATDVNGGGLVVNGSIASSGALNINGGFVGGTGTLPATTVNNGGALAPGNSIGTIAVQGNLTFNAGGIYRVEVSPTAADRTSVTGSATLTGATVQVVALPGSFSNRSFTILNATGGLGNTRFAGLSTAGGIRASLDYNANNVFLLVAPGTIVLPGGATGNQADVANGINNAVLNGATPPAGFNALLNLGGTQLTNALSQVSGVSTGGMSQGATQMTTSFLTTVLSPASGGGPNSGSPGAVGFAREIGVGDWALSPGAAQAYAAVTPRDRRPPAEPYAAFAPKLTVWGQAYGGYNKVDGVATAGTSDTTARTYGLATGFDYRLMPDLTVGFALAGGSTSWGLAQNLGGGRSDVFQVGVYGVKQYGAAYVSGAVSYAWHDVTTNRTVSVAGTDKLESEFNAHSFGSRVEGGYRLATLAGGVTPYAALQVQNFRTPSHSETAVTGANTFALAYDAASTTVTRFELGSWFDRLFIVPDGSVLAIRTRVAWANDHGNGGSVSALFQTLPGSSFSVDGARAAPNSALLSAAADWRLASRVTVGARLDSEFASRSQTYAGTGRVSYAW